MTVQPGLTDSQFLDRIAASAGGVIVCLPSPEWNIAARLERENQVDITVKAGGKQALVTAREKIYSPYGEERIDALFSRVHITPAPVTAAERQDVVKAVRGLTSAGHGRYLLHSLLAGFVLDVIDEARLRPELDRGAALTLLSSALAELYEQYG